VSLFFAWLFRIANVAAGAQSVPRVLRMEHAVRLRLVRPHRMAGRLVGGSDGVILPALLELSDGLFPREGDCRRLLRGVGSEGGDPGEQGGDEGEDWCNFHGISEPAAVCSGFVNG